MWQTGLCVARFLFYTERNESPASRFKHQDFVVSLRYLSIKVGITMLVVLYPSFSICHQ